MVGRPSERGLVVEAATTPTMTGRTAPDAKPRRQMSLRRRRGSSSPKTMLALVAPSVALLVLINLYPIIYAGNQALHNGSLISGGPYAGFSNFSIVFHSPAFWHAVRFTAIFTVVGVFGSWIARTGPGTAAAERIPGRDCSRCCCCCHGSSRSW